MITLAAFRSIAGSFPDVIEAPHFEKISFRIRKKIFATYEEKKDRACVKLSVADQDVFCLIDKTVIYPVAGKLASQGWTYIELKKIKTDLFTDIITAAFW